MSKVRAFLAVLALAGLSACATAPEIDASADVRALALALQARDLPGIAARIDREALRTQATGIAREMAQEQAARLLGNSPRAQRLAAEAADAATPLIRIMTDLATQPVVLAALARQAGLTEQTDIPGRVRTAIALRAQPDGRVCVPESRSGPCLLYFTDSPDGWLLSQIEPAAFRARLSEAAGR